MKQTNNGFGTFFYHLPKNLVSIYSRKNVLWQALAVGLTYMIVISDFDWKYFQFFHRLNLRNFVLPAITVGGLLPIVLPFILFGLGKLWHNAKVLILSFTIGQAALLGWFISSCYKAVTGRVPPEFFYGSAVTDISQQFQFGFFRGGIFWGWPSSHTAVAFAVAGAISALYPKNFTAKVLALLYALYVGFGVSVSIHWFSEFVAGAIFGLVIGTVVGKSYYNRQRYA